jgi:hypothetical protein
MPPVQVKLIEGVFSAARKQQMTRRLADAMVSVEVAEVGRQIIYI